MASSKHFDANSARRGLLTPDRVDELRLRGYTGVPLWRHRAFITMSLKPIQLLHAAILTPVLTLFWLLALRPYVSRLWGIVFMRAGQWMQLDTTTRMVPTGVGGYFPMSMPSVDNAGIMPDSPLLIAAAILTVIFLAVSFLLPAWLTPLSYFIRAVCAVQSTSLFYFTFFAASFPHDSISYIFTMLMTTMSFITFIPAIMMFTYYIFDFSLGRKIALTAMIMGHLTVFTPIQYLVHLYILLHFSLLFMPVLYTIFGLLLDVMIFIAFYSWGMSWTGERLRPPAASVVESPDRIL